MSSFCYIERLIRHGKIESRDRYFGPHIGCTSQIGMSKERFELGAPNHQCHPSLESTHRSKHEKSISVERLITNNGDGVLCEELNFVSSGLIRYVFSTSGV
ncbi:unnamed protein product [Albugo candida]|uniref:Uncharacterized protein n=1 Tax=Albugo candida TaxID=65357 RepID=A0A024FZY2_9STRA|nr:unnamed protein product [Albugo candida]|eukprot:CCI39853.1 unnamed protein product [Albugo candida]